MKVSFRALAAVGLLAGFPVLVLALIGGMVTLEVFTTAHSVVTGAKLAILFVPVMVALAKGLFDLESRSGGSTGPLPGIVLTPAAQPELWELVRYLAGEAGTAPPDEIRLTAEVNAAVMEETRLLGLRVVRRRMFIGAPLLAGMRENQLTAVLVHELAHYSNQDTRFGGMTYRGQRTMHRTMARLNQSRFFQRLLAKFFFGYAKCYFRVSRSVCRRQELAADTSAARIAGTDAAASALREVHVLDLAWKFYMKNYTTIGWESGYLPEDFGAGFTALLADPARRVQLEKLRRGPAEDSLSPYDSHPPTAERIRAIEALPTVITTSGDRKASLLLRHSARVLDSALQDNLVDAARTKTRVDWPTLVHVAARDDAIRATAHLFEVAGTLGGVLDHLDEGRLTELAAPDVKSGSGVRAQRELARMSVHEGLSTAVDLALADAGLARWELSWSAPATLVIDEPHRSAVAGLVDSAVAADGSTAGLRAALATTGAGLAYRPTPAAPLAA